VIARTVKLRRGCAIGAGAAGYLDARLEARIRRRLQPCRPGAWDREKRRATCRGDVWNNGPMIARSVEKFGSPH